MAASRALNRSLAAPPAPLALLLLLLLVCGAAGQLQPHQRPARHPHPHQSPRPRPSPNQRPPRGLRGALVVSSSDTSYVSARPAPAGSAPDGGAPFAYWEPDGADGDNGAAAGPPPSPLAAQFHTKPASIIRTRESLQLGATFLNYTLVTSLAACLVECWISEPCDTAVYQEAPMQFRLQLERSAEPQPAQSAPESLAAPPPQSQSEQLAAYVAASSRWPIFGPQNTGQQPLAPVHGQRSAGNEPTGLGGELYMADKPVEQPLAVSETGFFVCYLFQCAKHDGFKCQFSAHNYYVSATKRRHSFAGPIQPLQASAAGSESEPAAPPGDPNPGQQDRPQTSTVESLLVSQETNHHQYANLRSQPLFNHFPSIRFRALQHQPDYYASRLDESPAGGLTSLIMAVMMGLAATGILLAIVSQKMRSIRARVANQQRQRRRLLSRQSAYLSLIQLHQNSN